MSRAKDFWLVRGVLLEEVGDQWAVFSPISGETHLLNDTSMALLEMMSSDAAAHPGRLAETLAAEGGLPIDEARAMVEQALDTFLGAGLVRKTHVPDNRPR